MQTNRLLSLTIFVALVGCGDDKTPTNSGQDPTGNPSSDSNDSDEEESEGQSESGGNNNTSSPTTTGIGGQTTTAGTTSDPLPPNESSGEGGSSSSSGGGFIVEDDTPNGNIECDVFAQDCPDGFKCMPWANDGGGSWNAAKCSPVARRGRAGRRVHGRGRRRQRRRRLRARHDVLVPRREERGHVHRHVHRHDRRADLPGPEQICDISNDGVIIICLDTCDPLTQDCPDGQICFFDGGTSSSATSTPAATRASTGPVRVHQRVRLRPVLRRPGVGARLRQRRRLLHPVLQPRDAEHLPGAPHRSACRGTRRAWPPPGQENIGGLRHPGVTARQVVRRAASAARARRTVRHFTRVWLKWPWTFGVVVEQLNGAVDVDRAAAELVGAGAGRVPGQREHRPGAGEAGPRAGRRDRGSTRRGSGGGRVARTGRRRC
jgi:hypothetical protein